MNFTLFKLLLQSRRIALLFALLFFSHSFLHAQEFQSIPDKAANDKASVDETELYDDVLPERIGSIELPEHFERLSRRYALLLESHHFLQKKLDVSVSAQAWTNYLDSLDYDRTCFTQSDIKAFERKRLTLCEDLKNGDLAFAVEVFDIFRTRVAERHAFIEQMLKEEQDYSIDEHYEWSRKEAAWPKDRQEQQDLWRKSLKNELLSRIVSKDYEENTSATTNVVANSEFGIQNSELSIGETSRDESESPNLNSQLSTLNSANNSELRTPNSEPNNSSELRTPNSELNNSSELRTPNSELNNGSGVTNSVPAPSLDMSPEGVVGRRHKQFYTIIKDADADYLIERFLCAFAQAYDPHSAYMPPTRVDDFEIDMNLKLCGIGATLQAEDGMAKIVSVMAGGPAGRDTRDIRLRENDKIFAVGQGDGPVEDVVHLPLDKIVKRIRGDKGTKVVLHVISASDPSGNTVKVVDLIRDDIKMEDAAATGRVYRVTSPLRKGSTAQPRERAMGYVKLPSFYGSAPSNPSHPDFRSATYDIKKIIAGFNDEVEGMILDLRSNGGGSLREAVELVGTFISKGPVVLVREPSGAQPIHDIDSSVAFRKPLVVLMDRSSASASEIVAAALQDYGRAVIVGDSKSHGKGSVQNVMELFPKNEKYGSMKVTIASFHRIDGGSTQNKGVHSDIVLPSIMEYMDIGEDKLPNALPWSSITPMPYKVMYPMGELIPKLTALSEERLAANDKWAQHMSVVEYFRELGERKSVPLSYEKRYELYASDSKRSDGLSDEEEEDKPSDSEDEEDDIVLDEALNILCDLVDLQGDSNVPEVTESDKLNMLDLINILFK